MKIIQHLLLTLLLISPAFAQSNFYTEAGVSYVALRGASYTSVLESSVASSSLIAGLPVPSLTHSVLGEDKSNWAPFIATGYSFSDRIGLRLSYHYLGNLSTSAKASVLVGGDVVSGEVFYHFTDTVHVLSLAPEFKWPVTSKLSIRLAPELNWVASRGEVLVSTLSPAIDVAPRRVRNEQDFSLGASVGVLWTLTERCDLTLGYKYTDLKPSWGREAHLISGGLHWNF